MSEQMRKEFEAWREKSAFWQVVGEDVKDDPSSDTASAGRMMSAAAWEAWQAALATQPQAPQGGVTQCADISYPDTLEKVLARLAAGSWDSTLIKETEKHLRALADNARRYRFLRDQALQYQGDHCAHGSVWVVRYNQPRSAIPELQSAGFGETLDANVDAAKKQFAPTETPKGRP